MKPIKLSIKTRTEKYTIILGPNLISKLSSIIRINSIKFKKCLIVVDNKVPKKFITKIKKNFSKKKFFVPILMLMKKIKPKTTDRIIKILLHKNFSREDCLIAIDGSITGDVVGFAASQF